MPYRYHYDPNQPRVPAGRHDGGEWTRDGAGDVTPTPARSLIQKKIEEPLRKEIEDAVRKAIEAVLALFAMRSTENGSEKRAVLEFNAREYPIEKKSLDMYKVKLLNRQEVQTACPSLEEVQKKTNEAAAEVQAEMQDSNRSLSPSQYGTAVHYCLKQKIDNSGDKKLAAEVSFFKQMTEGSYREKGSIRIDVLEPTDKETVCVYDIKTGRRGLYFPRMTEIASNVLRRYPDTKRIIVTEVRPQKQQLPQQTYKGYFPCPRRTPPE